MITYSVNGIKHIPKIWNFPSGEVGVDIFKIPMGDASKASAKGLLYVGSQEVGDLFLVDSVKKETEESGSNMLQTVYNNGEWIKKTTLDEIRSILNN